MSQFYEMMYILRPNLLQEEVATSVNRYTEILSENGASEIKTRFWGKRRLAYPIKKYQEGTYILVNYQGDGQQIVPTEKAMRLSEDVIRYMTIKLNKEPEISEDSLTDFSKQIAQLPVTEMPSPQPAPDISEEQPSQPAPDISEEQPSQPAPDMSEEQPSQPAPDMSEEQPSQPAPDMSEETETVSS